MYSAIDLSNYIVSKCINDGKPISNLQLQKILYYIQKTFLQNGKRAFPDEIEAWQFGPVVPDVYYHFCGFGAMPITNVYGSYSITGGDKKIIDSIVDHKRMLNPWELVTETHKRGGAWEQIYKEGAGNHQLIPVGLIKAEG